MRRIPRSRTLVLAAALGCGSSSDGKEDTSPTVVVTIFPVADLVARVAGDPLEVQTLLPPRASPATWEATPRQIRTLQHAAGYVTVGGGLDGWLDELGAAESGPPLLRLTAGMVLRRSGREHGGASSGDPHVWLDPILVRDVLLEKIVDFLVPLIQDTTSLRRRASALSDSLSALDAEIRETLAGAEHRSFVATHDAWSYFADRYGLVSLGSLYERPGHEPSAHALARLVDAARAAELTAVLAEPQLAETAARALASELGARVITVDPLGGPGLEDRSDYMSLMRFNARAFAQALERR
jgi:zinc transport system substrate-binding protein